MTVVVEGMAVKLLRSVCNVCEQVVACCERCGLEASSLRRKQKIDNREGGHARDRRVELSAGGMASQGTHHLPLEGFEVKVFRFDVRCLELMKGSGHVIVHPGPLERLLGVWHVDLSPSTWPIDPEVFPDAAARQKTEQDERLKSRRKGTPITHA